MPYLALIGFGAPAAAELCAPPSGAALHNPRWAAGEEIVLRFGGHKPGERDTAEKILAPLFDRVIGGAIWPWRYASPEETATLTFVVYRPDVRQPSADAAIAAFFHGNDENRAAFVSRLTGDIQLHVLKPRIRIDLNKAEEGPVEVSIPKLISTAPRLVAVPLSETEEGFVVLAARGLMLALAGAADVIDAMECETYEGVLSPPYRLDRLSEDDLVLQRGK